MKLETFEDWKQCITELCGIPLTPDYIEKRLNALHDQNDIHTQKFLNYWGEDHLKRVIDWFERAQKEFSA